MPSIAGASPERPQRGTEYQAIPINGLGLSDTCSLGGIRPLDPFQNKVLMCLGEYKCEERYHNCT